MDSKPLVLLIEDDKAIRTFVSTALSTQDYQCKCAVNGKEGLSIIMSYNPDVIVLDLGLPDMDGIDIIKSVREWSSIPIIVVSARSHEREKIEALDYGADDYLTKPFGIAELLARVRVALRHSKVKGENNVENKEFNVGELRIDFEKRKVFIKDDEVHLTPIEYKLLYLLANHPGKVLTHGFIIKEVWGASIGNETQSLRVFMASIRRKLEINPTSPRYILTEVGVGYRLADE